MSLMPPPVDRDFAEIREVRGEKTLVIDPIWAKFLLDLQRALNQLLAPSTTGTGAQVLQTSPTLITPNIGAAAGASLVLTGGITTGLTTFLHSTSAALANGAGAGAGTITNAPSAGNPTKWISINDNGTTRRIPAW